MGNPAKQSFEAKALKWVLRFIKFNIVGFTIFLIGTAIFAVSFGIFGEWSWVVASASGGVLQFVLISYVNRTKKGNMFEGCELRQQQENQEKKEAAPEVEQP